MMPARKWFVILAGLGILVAGELPAVRAGEPITAFGLSPDGRRFVVNGKPTFLAGFREGYVGGDWDPVYWNHTTLPSNHPISPNAAQVDYNAYADAILNAGMNMARCTLIHMVAGSGRVHGNNENQDAYNYPPTAPFTQRPWARTGGGLAWDGLPQYNLNEWNTWYWQRLAEWVQTANSKGVIVEVILFMQHNYYQLFTHYADNPLRPWNCNPDTELPNGYGQRAYPEYYGSTAVLRAAQEAYVDKVLDTIGMYPGVIYRVACEYNWTDTWVEAWAARIKDWAAAHGKQLVVQIGGTMQQMALMNSDVQSVDGQYSFRKVDGSTCDPPSLVEIRLAGHCGGQGYQNDAPTVHATLLWMWNDLPGKALTRDSDAEVSPGRKAWYAALTGGATAYCYHGYFRPTSNGEAATGSTTLADMLYTFDRMLPHDDLVVSGDAYVLAAPGQEYLAYFPNGGTAQINLSAATGTLLYDWYNPRTFVLSNNGTVAGGGTQTFTTPDTDDWALWIRSTTPVAPIIAQVTPDPDIVLATIQYTKQLSLLQGFPTTNWSVVAGPPGTQVNAYGLVSGWTPGLGDANTTVDFTIQASNAAGSDTKSWQVQVMPASSIRLSTSLLTRTVTICNNLPNDTFTVANGGVDTLSYSISDNASWLDVQPTSGTSTGEADTIDIIYDLTDLPPGEHSAVITVRDLNVANSLKTIAVDVHVFIPGDFDSDEDVDQDDFGYLQQCLSGAGVNYQTGCEDADLHGDGDVDQADVDIFLSYMSGANVVPKCPP